jgi:uncharacterized membrane protein HdeD (DUF308 family)
MASTFFHSWRMLLFRGIVALGFGWATWLRPGLAVRSLVLLFAAFALLDGLLAIWAAWMRRRTDDEWWVLLLAGFVGVGIGSISILVPQLSLFALLFYVAAWAIASGTLLLVSAVRLRKLIKGEWLHSLAGLASIGFGLLILARPALGEAFLGWLLASYAAMAGVVLVVLALRARSLGRVGASI